GWDAGSPLSTLSGGQVAFGATAALLVEALATAVLVAVVLGASSRRRSGAVAIGLTYSAMLLVAGPVTNAAINPVRATAVALLSAGSDTLALTQLWGFWLAALLGAAAVGLVVVAFGRGTAEVDDLVVDEEHEVVLDR
ncbi:MAG TPA: aquaporin, partial [Actinotalea sp.]|nr:aquaporin [Actinotalea sp.]